MPLKKTHTDFDIVRVRHMLEASQEALAFIKGRGRSDLDHDRQLLLSLIKELEMIGEAASKVSPEFCKRHPSVPWGVIVRTRHRLIHGYFDIDRDIVWKTVEQELPKLAELLQKVLT
ncbi:MAG: DUF86 domain-containing protein [Deltaproteobacteria bacterium]|nr:DUF86 domain-containing protein [Deltaproteobacteria bacterium]